MNENDIIIPDWLFEKWQEITNTIAAILNISAALIMITYDEYMEVLISSESEGNPYKKGDKKKWHGLYCETVIKTQQKLNIANAIKDEQWKNNSDIELGMIAYLGFPINFPNGTPFGSICILDSKENQFKPEQEKLLLQFKNAIELDLSIYLNFEKKQLKQIEKQVKWESIFENAPIGIVQYNKQGIITECNSKFSDIFGTTKNKLLGLNIINELKDQNIIKEIKNSLKKGVGHYKGSYNSVSGDKLTPVRILFQGNKNKNNEIDSGIGIIEDISILHKSEKRVLRLEQTQWKILESIGDVVVIIDKNGLNQYKSPNITSIFGWNASELIGKHTLDNIHPDDLIKATNLFNKIIDNPNERFIEDLRYRCKDGSYKYISFSGINMLNNPEINGILGNYKDITERIQTQQQLLLAKKKAEENELLFKSLFKDHSAIMLLIDPISGAILKANNSAIKYYGYTKEQLHLKTIQEINVLNNEAVEKERLLALKQNRNYFVFEHKLASGDLRIVEVHSSPIYYEKNKVLFSIIHDITNRKKQEKELQIAKTKAEENEAKYRNWFNEFPHQVFVWKKQGNDFIMVEANKKAHEESKNKIKNAFGIPSKTIWENEPDLTEKLFKCYNTKESISFEREYKFRASGKKMFTTTTFSFLPPNSVQIVIIDETEKQNALIKLIDFQKQLEKLTNLLKSTEELTKTGGWLFDVENKNMFWSDEMYRLYGLDINSIDAADKTHISESLSCYLNKDQKTIKESFTNCLNNGVSFDGVYEFKDYSNNKKWVRTGARPLYKDKKIIAVLGYLIDFTEQKHKELQIKKAKLNAERNKKELELKNSEIELNNERLESLLNISQFPTNSVQNLLDYALKEAIKLTRSKIGYIYFYNEEKKQFVLNTWSKNVMKECAVINPQTTYDLGKTGLWGEVVRQRKTILVNDYAAPSKFNKGTPKGHVALKRFLSIPIFSKDKIVAVAGVGNKAIDYTKSDIKQLTLLMDSVWRISEQTKMVNELEVAKEQAEESNRLKTSFLHNLSHEIRTPLNAIYGFATFLETDKLSNEKRTSYVSIIQESSNQLLDIVNDILTVSSLETKQEQLNISDLNINDVLFELITTFQPTAKKSGTILHFQKTLSDELTAIESDKTKLKQIISNLISNAIKFTTNGEIEVGYTLKGKQIELYVKDTGIGIKQEQQKSIFERFTQANIEIEQSYGGSGLGLSICKGFVELLGGTIWVKSELGKGSTFFFTLPYNSTNQNETPNKKLDDEKCVLVAEDEEYNFLLIVELLAELNIDFIRAKNGQEAIDLFKSNKNISLIIMDIKMPVLDGYSAAKEIKKLNSQIPIIAQSAYALESDIENYNDIFDDYLTKPLKYDLFIEKINSFMKRH